MNTPKILIRKGDKPAGWLVPLKVEQVLDCIPEVLDVPDFGDYTIVFQLKQKKHQKTTRSFGRRQVTLTLLLGNCNHTKKVITMYPISQAQKIHYTPLEIAFALAHEFGHAEDVHLTVTRMTDYPSGQHTYYAREEYAENAAVRVAEHMFKHGFLREAELEEVKRHRDEYLAERIVN